MKIVLLIAQIANRQQVIHESQVGKFLDSTNQPSMCYLSPLTTLQFLGRFVIALFRDMSVERKDRAKKGFDLIFGAWMCYAELDLLENISL